VFWAVGASPTSEDTAATARVTTLTANGSTAVEAVETSLSCAVGTAAVGAGALAVD
jgi:hypothetical protein